MNMDGLDVAMVVAMGLLFLVPVSCIGYCLKKLRQRVVINRMLKALRQEKAEVVIQALRKAEIIWYDKLASWGWDDLNCSPGLYGETILTWLHFMHNVEHDDSPISNVAYEVVLNWGRWKTRAFLKGMKRHPATKQLLVAAIAAARQDQQLRRRVDREQRREARKNRIDISKLSNGEKAIYRGLCALGRQPE